MKITLSELKQIIKNEIRKEKERLNENKYSSYNSKYKRRILRESEEELNLTGFKLNNNLLENNNLYFEYTSYYQDPEFDSSYKKLNNFPTNTEFSQYFNNNNRISVNNDDNKIEIITPKDNNVYITNEIIERNKIYKIYFSEVNKSVYLSEFKSDTRYDGEDVIDGDFSFDAPKYVLVLKEDKKEDKKEYIVFELMKSN